MLAVTTLEKKYCNIGNIIYNIRILVLRVVTSALFFERRPAGREDNGFFEVSFVIIYLETIWYADIASVDIFLLHLACPSDSTST